MKTTRVIEAAGRLASPSRVTDGTKFRLKSHRGHVAALDFHYPTMSKATRKDPSRALERSDSTMATRHPPPRSHDAGALAGPRTAHRRLPS